MNSPDDIQRLADGSWMFCFGARDCDIARLPLGSTFDVVYSPSHRGTIGQGWRFVRFSVEYKMDRVQKQYNRVYVEVERRPLDEAEIALMSTFIS